MYSRTIFYLYGVHFALRGGAEHRNLRSGENSQFKILTDSNNVEFLQYTEEKSKCNQGGLNHLKVKQKVVRAYKIQKILSVVLSDYTRSTYHFLLHVKTMHFINKSLKHLAQMCGIRSRQRGCMLFRKWFQKYVIWEGLGGVPYKSFTTGNCSLTFV